MGRVGGAGLKGSSNENGIKVQNKDLEIPFNSLFFSSMGLRRVRLLSNIVPNPLTLRGCLLTVRERPLTATIILGSESWVIVLSRKSVELGSFKQNHVQEMVFFKS